MNRNSQRSIHRRAFLAAAGTTGVALPFLEGMPERSAFAQTAGKTTFGFYISAANGVAMASGGEPERFWPTATGALTTESMKAFANERCTGILADHASRLLIIRNVDLAQPNVTGCGHAQGLAQCLTAKPPTGNGNTTTSTGPSVDTIISAAVNPQGVSPLNVYTGAKGGYIDDKLSFSAAGQVRSGEQNPYNVYTRLAGLGVFEGGGGGGGNPTADILALRRKSVNDLIHEQITRLKSNPNLSRADQDRLQLHFDSIRDIEVTMGEMGAACSEGSLDMAALQAINSGQAFKGNDNFEQVVKLHADLVGLAFSCNANRVATMQVGDGTDGTQYTIDGQRRERFHHISHRINSDGTSGTPIAGAAELHAKIDRIRMETLKAILDQWAQYSTPDGPLLDNAFLYWTTHVAQGPSHSMANMPLIIAGSGGGVFKQGQYIDGGRAKIGTVLTGTLRAFGIQDNFNADGPLAGMMA
jgi:Protein of unknown function (DUF1552)